MIRLWNSISLLGIAKTKNTSDFRYVRLANRLAVLLIVLSSFLCVYFFFTRGKSEGATIISFILVYLAVLLLNVKGYHRAGRIFFCLALPFLVLAISIIVKLNASEVVVSAYFSSRMVMVILPSFPLILFPLKEYKILTLALFGSLLPLLLFDFFHELADVGFHQVNLSTANYSYINVITVISCFLVLMITFIFKKNSMETEKLLVEKNNTLFKQKSELQDLYNETESQNEEIQSQTEELTRNQEVLEEANKFIALQKEALLSKNQDLQAELILKNVTLEVTNKKLANHVNELEQFSYTLSHNLRGPVASLLGLTYLCSKIEKDKKSYELIEHISVSAQKVDQIIKDLSNIIDIRSESSFLREWVDPEEVLNAVRAELQEEINASGAYIEFNFEAKKIFSVKSFFYSILFQLISNSLRFRTSSRPLQIFIRTYNRDKHTFLEVKDNGQGIDLEKYRTDVFRMYKRFHEGKKGRGLGLYLVKLQAEVMGGGVSVKSEPGSGTHLFVDLGEANFLGYKTG